MNSTNSYYRINKTEWEALAAFILPWLAEPDSRDTIEDYYKLHSMALKQHNCSLIITLPQVLGWMMLVSLEQIVVYPEDLWQYVDIYYNSAEEPEGYNIVPKIQVTQ